MKKSLFLLFFFAFFFATQTSHDVSLNSFQALERSPAGRLSGDCLDLARNFLAEEKPHLTIPRNSFFGKYPTLVLEMEKLEFIPLNLDNFYKDFLKKKRRPPTLRDGMEYIYKLRRAMIKNYDEVIADLNAMADPTLEPFINEIIFSRNKLNKFKEIDAYEEELNKASDAGIGKMTSIDEPITLKHETIEPRFLNYLKDRSREGNFNGEIGELTALGASKDKVIEKGLKFETRQLENPIPYQIAIADAIAKLEVSLNKKSDKQLVKLVETYGSGNGLLRNAHAYLNNLQDGPINRDVLIGKIISMIRTKEIDLVFLKSDGRFVWGEVKTYKKPITMEVLNGGGYKLKPMADQLREHIALRDILGFKDTVDLRFISPTSKVTPEAKKYIEALGFEVISAK